MVHKGAKGTNGMKAVKACKARWRWAPSSRQLTLQIVSTGRSASTVSAGGGASTVLACSCGLFLKPVPFILVSAKCLGIDMMWHPDWLCPAKAGRLLSRLAGPKLLERCCILVVMLGIVAASAQTNAEAGIPSDAGLRRQAGCDSGPLEPSRLRKINTFNCICRRSRSCAPFALV